MQSLRRQKQAAKSSERSLTGNHQFIIFLVHSFFNYSFYYSVTHTSFFPHTALFFAFLQSKYNKVIPYVGKYLTRILKHFKN